MVLYWQVVSKKRALYSRRAIAGAGIVLLAVVVLLFLSGGALPDGATIAAAHTFAASFVSQHFVLGALLFVLAYLLIISLSLPLAMLLSLLAGALFGTFVGTVLVVAAATLGATLAFVLVRFFFCGLVTRHFGHQLAAVNRELAGHGFRDLLLIRLVPLVPFGLINVAAALTHVRVRDFALATLLGIIPLTIIYVNAGTHLATITSADQVLSFDILLALSLFVLAAAAPFFIRRKRTGGLSPHRKRAK